MSTGLSKVQHPGMQQSLLPHVAATLLCTCSWKLGHLPVLKDLTCVLNMWTCADVSGSKHLSILHSHTFKAVRRSLPSFS